MENSLKNKVISGMMWRFMERILAQLVTFIVSIILARLLAPSDYGTISLTTIFISIANVFVVDGLGKALIQKKEADNIDFSTAFYANIIFSIFLYIIVFAISPVIAKFYKQPVLTLALRVLALRIPLAAINSVQQAYVSRNMQFKRYFWSTLLGTLISAVVGIYMAIRGYGVWALVAQYLTNSFIDTGFLWFTVKWRPDFVFDFKRLKNFFVFGMHILTTSLFNTFYDNLRSLVIGKTYTTTDLAHYNRGQNYPKLIVDNVNITIGAVLYPAFSKMQDDKRRMKEALRKAISSCSFVIFPLMYGLFAIAPDIVRLMLTDKWMPCVPFLRIACIYFSLYHINTANLQALIALGESKIYAKLNIYKKSIGIVLLLISMPFGVFYMALTEIIAGVFAVLTNININKKYLDYSLFELLKDIGNSLFLSVIMCISIIFIDTILSKICSILILIIIIKIILGFMIYFGMSYFLKLNELRTMLSTLKGVKIK